MGSDDVRWMKRALREAAKGWGTTSPNPLVGAVIVRNGRLLGAGHHVRAGEAHAEINAIAACGRKSLRGATIYVTLEPCSTYGRTGPCTEAILNTGIVRVVFGCTDPNPNHAGRFFKWITTGKPYVLLKMAQTLDGKTATRGGLRPSLGSIAPSGSTTSRSSALRRTSDSGHV